MEIDSIVAAAPPPLLGPAESRAQRLQRQQSRFRDRGGIFVPTARNTLVDILLGKSTAPQQRRSVSCSPVRVSKTPGVEKPRGISDGPRNGGKSLAKSGHLDEALCEDQPIPGPSRIKELSKPSKKTGTRKPKAKAVADVSHPPSTEVNAPNRRGKAKATTNALQPAVENVPETPAPKRRGRPPKSKPSQSIEDETRESQTQGATARDLPQPKKPKRKAVKKRQRVVVTDESGEESDYTSQKKPRKRVKTTVTNDPPPATTVEHDTKPSRPARARSKKVANDVELSDTEGHEDRSNSKVPKKPAALDGPVLEIVPDATPQESPSADAGICGTDSLPIADAGPTHTKKNRVVGTADVCRVKEVINKKSKNKRLKDPTHEEVGSPDPILACKTQPTSHDVSSHQREPDDDGGKEKPTRRPAKSKKAGVVKPVKNEQNPPPEKTEKAKRRRKEVDSADSSGDEIPPKRIAEVILKPKESHTVLSSSRTKKENSRKAIKETTRPPVKRATAKRGTAIPKHVLERIRKASHQLDDGEPDPINCLS